VQIKPFPNVNNDTLFFDSEVYISALILKFMELNDKVIREISAIVVVVLFGILVFFAIKPLIFAVLWGLILAYIFNPVYLWINKVIRNKTLAVSIMLVLIILIIMLPLWFIAPMIVQQVFEVFRSSQALDITGFIKAFFPTASAQFVAQLSTTISTLLGKATSTVMSSIVDTFMNLPLLAVNLFIMAFVFFFALRDSGKLKEFARGVSPLNKAKEKIVVKHFKDITYSIVYGHLIVRIIQGLLAGLGFFIFGVSNAFVLSIIAIFLCILPVVGAFLLWIPIAIYMFVSGNTAVAIAFVLYNAIIVSNIDNVLLAYFVSKRTNLSPVFTLISSIGGLFLFGIIGLVLGPLIFAYFIILLDLYREKNLLSLFSSDDEAKEEPKTPPETK
jgi:predicted PurR-regulated permease PerM